MPLLGSNLSGIESCLGRLAPAIKVLIPIVSALHNPGGMVVEQVPPICSESTKRQNRSINHSSSSFWGGLYLRSIAYMPCWSKGRKTDKREALDILT